ncbi:MAG: site-specific tyrosine recombinase XerC [Chloroflexota bacterium]
MLRRKLHGGPGRRAPDLPDNALTRAMVEFLAWSEATGCTEATIATRKQSLRIFVLWCGERSIGKPQDVTLPILERYQRYLFHYRKSNGQALGFISQRSRLVPVKTFFKWLTRSRYILYNPASELVLPRPPKRLPRHIFTLEEIETIAALCDVETPQGVRDRAVIETLYSTGIRRMGLGRLKVYDVDLDGGALLVREGKGRKDRMVPIGARACAWIAKYLADARPQMVMEPDEGVLFLTDYGEPLRGERLGYLVRGAIERAGYTFPGSCHLFRHAMATHMLENGADTRFIQAMLGHAKLTTTEIYTQVSILKLKEIHSATHPARLARATRAQDAPGAAGRGDGRRGLEDARNALLAALEAEDRAEDLTGADRGERREQRNP